MYDDSGVMMSEFNEEGFTWRGIWWGVVLQKEPLGIQCH